MGFYAKVLLDSVSPAGSRLTTMEVQYPRFVHSEFMTHRVFSRNAASSRAIPVEKMLKRIVDDPAMPVHWGRNQQGMVADEEIPETDQAEAQRIWLYARDQAVQQAACMSKLGIHKQIVNRLLEPFAWITVIVTGTEWENFFTQRCHPDAQPELQHVANLMQSVYVASSPMRIECGQWHTPLIQDDEHCLPKTTKIKVSVARCARVSYLNHDGIRSTSKDIELYEKLISGGANGHWSPFEHVATPSTEGYKTYGNVRGWIQWRKFFPDESGRAGSRGSALSSLI